MPIERLSVIRYPLLVGAGPRSGAFLGLLTVVMVAAACAKQKEVTPPDAPIVSASHCAEMRKLLTTYPNTMVEREPERLRVKMPTIAPARRDTSFTVSFVVNTVGKPVASTVVVSKHVGPRFTTALKASISSWTYRPALHKGCPVPRKVSHTIDVSKTRTP